MGVPHVTMFCWCLELEEGAKVIGFLHMMLSLSIMLVSSVFANHMGEYAGTVVDAVDGVYTAWFVIGVVVAVFSVVHALLGVMLVVAAYKRWSGCVRWWAWVMGALWAAALGSVAASALKGPRSSGSDIFLSFLEGVLFFGGMAYCILAVNSYYLKLKSDEDMEGPSKNDTLFNTTKETKIDGMQQ